MAHRIWPKYPRLFPCFSLGLLCVFYINYTLAQSKTPDFKRTVIDDPSISRRCEELLDIRRGKLANKNRLMGLIERNQILQRKTPENKKSIKERLEVNLGHLKNELQLVRVQIQIEEESIIRKGCPGIAL